MAFIDTDVIIRFLTGDDLKKQVAAKALFTRVQKKDLTIFAPDTVIADAVFVLSSKKLYNLPREEVKELLMPLLLLSHFQVQNKTAVIKALELYATNKIDFGDCFIITSMEQANDSILYSYDKDYDDVPTIARIEPPIE